MVPKLKDIKIETVEELLRQFSKFSENNRSIDEKFIEETWGACQKVYKKRMSIEKERLKRKYARQIDENKDLQRTIKILVPVIDYYATPENWIEPDKQDRNQLSQHRCPKTGEIKTFDIGGEYARRTIEALDYGDLWTSIRKKYG